jgi:hypothetical protein
MFARLILLLALASIFPGAAQTRPDFQGIWNSSTATPLERPARFKDKPYFTPEEAAQFERQAAAQNEDRPSQAFASYNGLFYERGTKLPKDLRTSIITDPPDGKLPALAPAAADERKRRIDLMHHPRNARDLGLQDQCIVFSTAVPMMPYIYNSYLQFIETAGAVMINVEMVHDTRVIHLDRQSHLASGIRLWLGDSIGHWENGTLVVDTTNFIDNHGFYGESAGGIFTYDQNLHVVERFTLLDANSIQYGFEVDDPTTYTRPWKGELTFSRTSSRIFEYACHEGNYALPDLLRGLQ